MIRVMLVSSDVQDEPIMNVSMLKVLINELWIKIVGVCLNMLVKSSLLNPPYMMISVARCFTLRCTNRNVCTAMIQVRL